MKGLLGKHDDKAQSQSDDESPKDLRLESPAIIEGVEQNDQSLNIKINKSKMFSKPPMIPSSQPQKGLDEMNRPATPERQLEHQPPLSKMGTNLNIDFFQRKAMVRSNSIRNGQQQISEQS